MSAYVIVQVRFNLGPELAQYREHAVPAIQRYGGKFVVRGKEKALVEGEENGLDKVIMIEFPSLDDARRWYESPEYAKALALSTKAMTRQLFIVESD
jgi:uncharacterized protein (DUF1330 family)